MDEFISPVIEKGEIDPDEFDNIKAGYIKEYNTRNRIKTKVYDGMMDLLWKLKSIGVKINILSNKPHFQTEEVVQYYLSNVTFDFICGKKPEFPIKPNPQSVLDMISKLQLDKSEILYVGDTNTDIQTAKNAKLKSVGVTWGFRTKEELIQEGADYIVSNPEEIYKIVIGD